MWHIEAPDSNTLDGYASKLLGGLKQRVEKCGIDEINNALLKDDTGNETDEILKNLLVYPPDRLRDLSESLMTKIISDYDFDELADYAKVRNRKDEDLTDDKKELKKKYTVLKKLEDLFGYDEYLGKSTKKTFAMVKRVGHNTCVYCNRQYAFCIVKGEGKIDAERLARPALDHWYPKSLFPLMSLSYYNLIPSCTICNSSVKHDDIWTLETHIHPYMTKTSDPGFSFKYRNRPYSKWEVFLDDYVSDHRVKKTAEDLCLEEAYQCHSELEVTDLLEIARKDNGTYLNQVYDVILQKLGSGTDKEKAYRILLGTEMAVGKYKNRPFSKLKRDILKQLEMDEGIKFMFD